MEIYGETQSQTRKQSLSTGKTLTSLLFGILYAQTALEVITDTFLCTRM